MNKPECVHCSHGGTCTVFGPEMEDFKCLCTAGFRGRHCEHDIDECETQLAICPPSSTCHNTIGSYTCHCPVDQILLQSECLPKITCADQPCLNGALCYNIHGKHRDYSCECDLGFTGVDCETPVPTCPVDVCGQHGVCITTVSGYFCDCAPSYSGKRCQNVNVISPSLGNNSVVEISESQVPSELMDVLIVGASVFSAILVVGCFALYVLVVEKRYNFYENQFQTKNEVFWQSVKDTCCCRSLDMEERRDVSSTVRIQPRKLKKSTLFRLKQVHSRIDRIRRETEREIRGLSAQLSKQILRPGAKRSLEEMQNLIQDV